MPHTHPQRKPVSRYPRALRAAAAFLVLAFGTQDIAFAAPIAAGLPDFVRDPAKIQISHSVAQISGFHRGAKPRLLIHIQDAHANVSAQENLAKALDEIVSRYGVKTVFVEGGVRDVSLSFLRPLASRELRERVAKKYLMRGELKGAEYVSLASDRDLELWGVEDAELYRKNLDTYARVVAKRDVVRAYLDQIDRRVKSLKRQFFSKQMIEFDELVEGFERKERDFTEYYEGLRKLAEGAGVNLLGYPAFVSLKDLKAREEKIDFEAANREQEELARRLFTSAEERDQAMRQMAGELGKLKSQSETPYAIYETLFESAAAKRVQTDDLRNLTNYVDYLKAYAAVDLTELFSEARRLEDTACRASIADPETVYLYEIGRHVKVLKTLFSLQISPEHFREYMERKAENRFATVAMLGFMNRKMYAQGNIEDVIQYYPILDENLPIVEDFYVTNEQRDQAFLKNAFEKMDRDGLSAAVLITGGYHTPNLKSLLEKQEISYAVITPHITHETNQRRYEEILLGQLGSRNPLRDLAKNDSKRESSRAFDFLYMLLRPDAPLLRIVTDDFGLPLESLPADIRERLEEGPTRMRKAGARLASADEQAVSDALRNARDESEKLMRPPSLASTIGLSADEALYEMAATFQEDARNYEADNDAQRLIEAVVDTRIILRNDALAIREQNAGVQAVVDRLAEMKRFNAALNELRFRLERARGVSTYTPAVRQLAADAWKNIARFQNLIPRSGFERELERYSKFVFDPMEKAFEPYLTGAPDNARLLEALTAVEVTFNEMLMWMARERFFDDSQQAAAMLNLQKDYYRLLDGIELAVRFDRGLPGTPAAARLAAHEVPAAEGKPSVRASYDPALKILDLIIDGQQILGNEGRPMDLISSLSQAMADPKFPYTMEGLAGAGTEDRGSYLLFDFGVNQKKIFFDDVVPMAEFLHRSFVPKTEGARMAEWTPVAVPSGYVSALADAAGLVPAAVDVLKLKGRGSETALLEDANARYVIGTSLSQALGSILWAGEGKDVKEVADANAVVLGEKNLTVFVKANPGLAVVIIGDEGARDGSVSLDMGSIYYADRGGKLQIQKFNLSKEQPAERLTANLAAFRALLAQLQRDSYRTLFQVGDALENTNGLVDEEAKQDRVGGPKPTSAWAMTATFFEFVGFVDDGWRMGGWSYSLPQAAAERSGITSFDSPPEFFAKKARALGIEPNPDSPVFQEFMNRQASSSLGPRKLPKPGETAQHRNFRIIADNQKIAAEQTGAGDRRYPNFKIITIGDGDLALRVVAVLGLPIDYPDGVTREVSHSGRSGIQEFISSLIATANDPDGQCEHTQTSPIATNSDYSAVTAHAYAPDEDAWMAALGRDDATLPPNARTSRKIGSRKDIPGQGHFALSAVTGADAEVYGRTLADAMPRISFTPVDAARPDGPGIVVVSTLAVTPEGAFVVRTRLRTENLSKTRESLKYTSTHAKEFRGKPAPARMAVNPALVAERQQAEVVGTKLWQAKLSAPDAAIAKRFLQGGYKQDGWGVPSGAVIHGSYALTGNQGYFTADEVAPGKNGLAFYTDIVDSMSRFFKDRSAKLGAGKSIRVVVKTGIGGQHTPFQGIADHLGALQPPDTRIVGEYELGKDYDAALSKILADLGAGWDEIAVIPSSKSGSTDETMMIFVDLFGILLRRIADQEGLNGAAFEKSVLNTLREINFPDGKTERPGQDLFKVDAAKYGTDSLIALVAKNSGHSEAVVKKIFGKVLGNMFFETTDRVDQSRLSAFVRNSKLDRDLPDDAPRLGAMFDNVGGRWTADLHMATFLAFYGLDANSYWKTRNDQVSAAATGGNELGDFVLDQGIREIALVVPDSLFWFGKSVEQNVNESIWQNGFVNLVAYPASQWHAQQANWIKRPNSLVLDAAVGLDAATSANFNHYRAVPLTNPLDVPTLAPNALAELFGLSYGMTTRIGNRLIARALADKGMKAEDVNVNDLDNPATRVVQENLYVRQPFVELGKGLLEDKLKKLQAAEQATPGAIDQAFDAVRKFAAAGELRTNIPGFAAKGPMTDIATLADALKTAADAAKADGRKFVPFLYLEAGKFAELRAQLVGMGYEWVLQGTGDQHISYQQVLAQPQRYLVFFVSFVPETAAEAVPGRPAVGFAKGYLHNVSPHYVRDAFAEASYQALTDLRQAEGGRGVFVRLTDTLASRTGLLQGASIATGKSFTTPAAARLAFEPVDSPERAYQAGRVFLGAMKVRAAGSTDATLKKFGFSSKDGVINVSLAKISVLSTQGQAGPYTVNPGAVLGVSPDGKRVLLFLEGKFISIGDDGSVSAEALRIPGVSPDRVFQPGELKNRKEFTQSPDPAGILGNVKLYTPKKLAIVRAVAFEPASGPIEAYSVANPAEFTVRLTEALNVLVSQNPEMKQRGGAYTLAFAEAKPGDNGELVALVRATTSLGARLAVDELRLIDDNGRPIEVALTLVIVRLAHAQLGALRVTPRADLPFALAIAALPSAPPVAVIRLTLTEGVVAVRVERVPETSLRAFSAAAAAADVLFQTSFPAAGLPAQIRQLPPIATRPSAIVETPIAAARLAQDVTATPELAAVVRRLSAELENEVLSFRQLARSGESRDRAADAIVKFATAGDQNRKAIWNVSWDYFFRVNARTGKLELNDVPDLVQTLQMIRQTLALRGVSDQNLVLSLYGDVDDQRKAQIQGALKALKTLAPGIQFVFTNGMSEQVFKDKGLTDALREAVLSELKTENPQAEIAAFSIALPFEQKNLIDGKEGVRYVVTEKVEKGQYRSAMGLALALSFDPQDIPESFRSLLRFESVEITDADGNKRTIRIIFALPIPKPLVDVFTRLMDMANRAVSSAA